MARAFPLSDMHDPASDPQPGEWQALRGELVALLDQVEGRFNQAAAPKTAYEGLTQRVRNLRDQVDGTAGNARHREALKTVKRAVDRFSERDETDFLNDTDSLQSAIAEIRGRQLSAPMAAVARHVAELPQFGELTALVGGLSHRLERLEGELKSQRAGNGNVREVASQVEQLSHVVELLAGAVGETGQVKRLETQIAGLARLIGEAPKVDLSAVNKRLDDVSTTVGKLAELQAQQMEREVARQDRADGAAPAGVQSDSLGTSMLAIEQSVRNVYDRIDSIERNVTLSAGDFERLTAEMSAFTKAVRDKEVGPSKLVDKIDALQARIGGFESSNNDVAGLQNDIAALRDVVLAGVEPRFARLETQLEALSVKMDKPRAANPSVAQIESQLKKLISRMDETGAQLNGLTQLYSAEPDASPDFEALAMLVAQRTASAVSKSAGPAAAPGISEDSFSALEQRMSAMFNTAGKDTAQRLAKLEAALSKRAAEPMLAPAALAPRQAEPVAQKLPEPSKLNSMLEALSQSRAVTTGQSDAMPANPAEDAPLRDVVFQEQTPPRAEPAPVVRKPTAAPVVAATAPRAPAVDAPVVFDPAGAQRPPRPQSSLDAPSKDPFAEVQAAPRAVEPPQTANAQSTSTFVAAARRAQRAKQDTAAPPVSGNSLISRALARVMPAPADPAEARAVATEPAAEKTSLFARKPKAAKAPKAVDVPVMPEMGRVAVADIDAQPSFLTRYRRPLLLAATLVVVSLLALNLVMQRVNSSAPVVEPSAEPAAMDATPEKTSDLGDLVDPASLPTDPRVISMVDNSTTGSINPASTSSFSKSSVETTPMPPTLLASTGKPLPATIDPVDVPNVNAEVLTGSIPAKTDSPIKFELAPEAVGPIELRQAAADGDARAQFEIGAIYGEGRAVTQDYKASATWYERAAAQGFAPAQYRLGNLYETGNGVTKDLEMAKLWYQRSADSGNRMAMHNLAALFASGQLGEQKFEQAAEWFEQAGNLGMTDSQFNLGMLHARGLGVPQDMEQSFKWFSLAARDGDADAVKARDDIAKSLTADVVKKVKAEVDAWKPGRVNLAANFAPIGTWSPKFNPGEAIASKDVISKVQKVLGKLGYDIGTPDGITGPKTAEAIKAFERGTGMTETGTINPRLLAVLGSQPV
ncbi:peptidoglycan-binding protein [Devosia sp.]|uniref:peptidoglycan-binding protein n=1 Tax=Devosia sp. TaxID=1871048 RepID=UPI0032652441